MPKGTKIALEMLNINRIEAYEGRVQPKINLRHLLSKDVRPIVLRKEFLQPVQGIEYRHHIFIVHLLVWSKSGLVDSSVEILLHPVTDLIDLIS